MNVPNGGVSALLVARIRLSFGSNITSSARLLSPDAVETALTRVGGKLVVLNETTRLGASVTNRQCPPVTTPASDEVWFNSRDGNYYTAPPGNPASDRIIFDTAHGVDAQEGAEQPQWDPVTQRFYVSIPQIGANVADGGVVRINTATNPPTVDKTFAITFCSPPGLSKSPDNDFVVGCNTVFDTAGAPWSQTDTKTAAPIQVILNVPTGKVVSVGGVGTSDEVWFNSGDGNYYTASSNSPLRPLDLNPPNDSQGAAVLGVIDAEDKNLIQLDTDVHRAGGSGQTRCKHPAFGGRRRQQQWAQTTYFPTA
jgi:hypothetical protein